MVDYSAGEITTEESSQIIRDLNEQFHNEYLTLYPGCSLSASLFGIERCKGWCANNPCLDDILDKNIRAYLPAGQNSELLLDMMKRSREFLKDHPVNQSRIRRGLPPVSSVWFWGEGRKPNLTPFEEKYHVKGSVVSAVDLIKGIGICAGLNSIDVEGATGTVHTNFEGKAQAAIDALKNGSDFVYVHLEAPDECGHQHDIDNKVRSIELIDEKIIAPIMNAMKEAGEDFSIMVLPDHPTPLNLRTHTSDPVPFALYRSNAPQQNGVTAYNERTAESTGVYVEQGYQLMGMLISES